MAEKQSGETKKQGGESAYRQENNERGGGVSLNEPLEPGQLRGVDEEGHITTGTHGGPVTPQSSNPNHPQHGRPEEDESLEIAFVARSTRAARRKAAQSCTG